jgi:hypothetical protein
MQPERSLSAFSDPVTELLLLSFPLIRIAGGAKRQSISRAWLNAAQHKAAEWLDMEIANLPKDPRAAALAIVRTAFHLAAASGIGRPELVQFFNDAGESGEFAKPHGIDESVQDLLAHVLTLMGQRLAQENATREARVGAATG